MILELKDIKYTYPDGYIALENLNATIEDKSFVVVLGESGSGKTTLFKIIAGILDPDEGNVYLTDIDVTNMKTASRDLTMVFQNFPLYPHLTIYHNVMLALNGFDMSEEEKDMRVKDILTSFGLQYYLNFKPKHLSDGQKQRVCIAKALIREPSLLLLDEPLSNLDLPQKIKIKAELKDIFKKYNSTFIYISHDIKDVEELSTLVWIMNNGQIIQQGTLKELKEAPRNLKVFQLVNEGNLNEYDVEFDGKYLKNNAFSIPINEKRTKKDYILAFTYTDTYVDENGPIKGEILSIKMLPSGLYINAKLKDDTLIGSIIEDDEEINIKEGDVVHFNVKPNRLKLFSAKSNKIPR